MGEEDIAVVPRGDVGWTRSEWCPDVTCVSALNRNSGYPQATRYRLAVLFLEKIAEVRCSRPTQPLHRPCATEPAGPAKDNGRPPGVAAPDRCACLLF